MQFLLVLYMICQDKANHFYYYILFLFVSSKRFLYGDIIDIVFVFLYIRVKFGQTVVARRWRWSPALITSIKVELIIKRAYYYKNASFSNVISFYARLGSVLVFSCPSIVGLVIHGVCARVCGEEKTINLI